MSLGRRKGIMAGDSAGVAEEGVASSGKRPSFNLTGVKSARAAWLAGSCPCPVMTPYGGPTFYLQPIWKAGPK